MRESQCRDEVGLRDFLGFAFNHDHLVLCPHVDKIKVARGALTVHRIYNKLAIDTADADRSHRPGETECPKRKAPRWHH